MYFDLKNNTYIEYKDSKSLKFLYDTILGRFLLKIVTSKAIANIYAKYMNSKLSKHKIKKFIKKNNINMDDYLDDNYNSFNDFFVRKIKPNKRIINNGLIAVCDSKLSAYEIDENSKFYIKNSIYTVKELIDSDNKYKYALVFRLCVDDYHHYSFPDDGKIVSSKHINGKLHTVQPIAFKKYKVFTENDREVTFMKCSSLGNVCYVEVGAMFIGKIVNEKKLKFKKGDEKGHFEFGGSTVIVLLEKDVKIDERIIENTKKGVETIVKLGQKIGE